MEKLTKYFENQCTNEEALEVDSYLKDDANTAEIESLMAAQWNNFDENSIDSPMPDFDGLLLNIKDEARISNLKVVHRSHKWRFALKIAASILLPVMLFFAAKFAFFPANSQMAMEVAKSEAGKRSKVDLIDGSRIWMNNSSQITYTKDFAQKRLVRVDGEAYFDVAKLDGKPFVVEAGNVQITVTGTEFNVTNYSETKVTEIILVEGSVKLTYTHPSTGKTQTILLKPSEKAVFDKEKGTMEVMELENISQTSWKDGKLEFIDTPFSEVVFRMGKWYNVHIVYDQALKNDKYTATLTNEPIEKVLKFMNLTSGIKYRIENNTVYIGK